MQLSPLRTAAVCFVVVALAAFVTGCGATEPVAAPSTVPGPESSAGASLGLTSNRAEFEARLRDATTREGVLVRDLAAASIATKTDMQRVVAAMRAWIAGERAWLADHPADPCYDGAVTKLAAALDAMTAAADQFAALPTGTEPASASASHDSAGAAAVQSLQDASRALVDAAALAKASRPNCT